MYVHTHYYIFDYMMFCSCMIIFLDIFYIFSLFLFYDKTQNCWETMKIHHTLYDTLLKGSMTVNIEELRYFSIFSWLVRRIVKGATDSQALSYAPFVSGALRVTSVSLCWCLTCSSTAASCWISTYTILHPCCWCRLDITSGVYGMYEDKDDDFHYSRNAQLTYNSSTYLLINQQKLLPSAVSWWNLVTKAKVYLYFF